MVGHILSHSPLPCRADRKEILEQAKLVLTKARAIAEQVDQSVGPLSAEPPSQFTRENKPFACESGQGLHGEAPMEHYRWVGDFPD